MLKKSANTGQEVQYTYDSFGFLSEESEKIEEGRWKHYRYKRDAYGRMIKETDSLGHTTVYTYEDYPHHLPQASSEENAAGERTRFTYDSAGRRISITNPCQTTELRYNRQNYLTYVKDGNGNEVRRTYDYMGNLTAYFPPNQGIDGTAWMYRYDFFDRMIEARDPLGNSWKQERNLAGDVLSKTTPEGYVTKYEYDHDSRKLRTIYPDGSVERNFYDHNGNLVKKVRPAYYDKETDDGLGSIYTYDSMNRLLEVTDEEGHRIVKHTYDMAGNLVEVQNGEGVTVYHTYDLAGNKTATWSPLEEDEKGEIRYRTEQFIYDTEGNKILERRGLDKVKLWEVPSRFLELQFSYDALNRLILVSDGCGARAAYHYDSQDHVIQVIGPDGELLQENTYNLSGTVKTIETGGRIFNRYDYDLTGNPTAFYQGKDNAQKGMSAQHPVYDAWGNVIRAIDGEENTTEFVLDAWGRITEIKDLSL